MTPPPPELEALESDPDMLQFELVDTTVRPTKLTLKEITDVMDLSDLRRLLEDMTEEAEKSNGLEELVVTTKAIISGRLN